MNNIEKNLKQMQNDACTQGHNRHRRKVLAKAMGMGAVTTVALPASWTKPMLAGVVLPAHAQTTTCPVLMTQAVFGPNSGGAQDGTCRVTITVLSMDAATPVEISAIESDVADPDTVTVDGLGEATDTTGPTIVWNGLAPGANFCQDLNTPDGAPTTDVNFTVTYTCEVVGSLETTFEFSLFDALENAEFA